MRHKPLTSLRGPGVRSIIAIGAALAAFTGVGLATASTSLADPTETLVVVGSDTIQDVYNQFALDAAGNLIGSYNATNPVTGASHEVITPVDGSAHVNCSFARPNGSTDGVSDLRWSQPGGANDPADTGLAPSPQPQQGCVDIARASSGPTASFNGASQQNNSGPLIYIPFALDAVAGSTGPANASSCPSYDNQCGQLTVTSDNGTQFTATPVNTNITTADDFTFQDLVTLYADCGTVTEGGITYNPNTATTGQQQIDLYVPQPGSGTRNFWASTLTFNPTTLPSCVHDHIVGGALASDDVAVEEHDGSAVATDPDGFGPFSIAQWISQRNGHNERRHGAVLHMLTPNGSTTPVSPFSNGNPATGSLNTSWPIVRDVYSVVSYARVTNTSDPLFSLLNGTGSFVCGDGLQILSYGFATIPTCGQINNANRVNG
jgi:hypothetical protein